MHNSEAAASKLEMRVEEIALGECLCKEELLGVCWGKKGKIMAVLLQLPVAACFQTGLAYYPL